MRWEGGGSCTKEGGGGKTHSLVRFVNCCVLLWAAPDVVTELVQILKENVSFLFLLFLILSACPNMSDATEEVVGATPKSFALI